MLEEDDPLTTKNSNFFSRIFPVKPLKWIYGVFPFLIICTAIAVRGQQLTPEERGKAVFDLQYQDPDSGVIAARQLIQEGYETNTIALVEWGYHCLGENFKTIGQYDSAHFYQKQALRVAQEEGDSMMMGRTYNSIGVNYKKQKKYDEAIHYYLKSLSIRTAMHDVLGMGKCSNNLGTVYRNSSELDSATKYFIDAIEYYREAAPEQLYFPATNLGNLYVDLEEYGNSIHIYQQGLHSAKLDSNFHQSGSLQYSIGRSYYYIDQLDSANHYYQLALGNFSSTNYPFGIADSYSGLGSVAMDQDLNNQALLYYLKAHQIYIEYNDEQGLHITLSNLGELYEREGQLGQAAEYYQRSVEFFEKVGNLKLLKKAYYNTFRMFKELRKDREALLYLEKYNSTKDTISVRENRETTLRLKEEFESVEKDLKIRSQDLQLREQQLKNAEQQAQFYQWLTWLGIALMLLITAAVILYYRQRSRALHTKLELDKAIKAKESVFTDALVQGQEAERTRIGRDLHDNVGAKLSNVKLQLQNLVDPKPQTVQEQMQQIIAHLDNTVDEVRHLSHNMVSGVLSKYGLAAAVKDLAISVRTQHGPNITVQVLGVPEHLSDSQELYLYRIIQELLSNSLKHAEASNIKIQLQKKGDQLKLMFTDDGKGFDLETTGKGIGLSNIQNRVQFLNGKMKLESGPSKGSTAQITIPLIIEENTLD